jgi:hypothetical protein
VRLAALTLLLGLAACGGGSVVPTVYQPGIYKGATDPLVARLEEGPLREQLQTRVQQQWDR